MDKRIKYNGSIYLLESALDKQIEDKVEQKLSATVDKVLGNNKEPQIGEAPVDEPLRETEEVNPEDAAPISDPTELPEEAPGATPTEDTNPQIDAAIEGIKETLGIADIDPDKLEHLKLVLSDIGAPTSNEVNNAPEMILHEGRIFRKIGKLTDFTTMMESANPNAPKYVDYGGKKYKLADRN